MFEQVLKMYLPLYHIICFPWEGNGRGVLLFEFFAAHHTFCSHAHIASPAHLMLCPFLAYMKVPIWFRVKDTQADRGSGEQ